MAQMTIPNVLKGTIDASKQRENYSAVVAALSDGTKDVSFATTTVGSDVNTASLTVYGDCTTTGEPVGERVCIPLCRGNPATGIVYSSPAMGPQMYLGEVIDSPGDQNFGFVIPRSGVVVGIGVFSLVANYAYEFIWQIKGLTAGTLAVSQTYTVSASLSAFSYDTFDPASQVSFSAGEVIHPQKHVYSGSSLTAQTFDNVYVEIQYT